MNQIGIDARDGLRCAFLLNHELAGVVAQRYRKCRTVGAKPLHATVKTRALPLGLAGPLLGLTLALEPTTVAILAVETNPG